MLKTITKPIGMQCAARVGEKDRGCQLEHYPFPPSSLALSEAIHDSLHRQNISQKAAAELLGIPASHFSEILLGKAEPSLSVARSISRQLHIDPAVVLGVWQVLHWYRIVSPAWRGYYLISNLRWQACALTSTLTI